MEFTNRVPALYSAEGVNAEDADGLVQAITDESREAERTRLSVGEAKARTYKRCQIPMSCSLEIYRRLMYER
jgi:hypothetical protein